ncbi:MAG TPA: TraB/GumN family protein [Ideonella sp.]|nr:TraB/GumN family protein [Ideonella sp.]
MKRSSRRWLVLLVALWAAGTALAAAPAPAASPDCPPQPMPITPDDVRQGMQAATDHGYLWRVRKDGRDSWLYGTLHVARKAWMFPGPAVRNAVQASDRVALELDMLDPEITRRLLALMMAPVKPVPLPAPLARRLGAQIAAACAGHELAALRPEMQAITLTVMAGRRAGLEPGYGIDGFLAGFARQAGKPVLSLETPEAQIGLIVQPTPGETATFVAHALDELEDGRAERMMRRLAEAWSRGDFDELSHYADWCECLDSAEDRAMLKRLVDDRNEAMATQLQTRHAQGERLLLAAGALHMIGPQGLPALLAARGFQVERVVAPAGVTGAASAAH